MDHSLGCVCCWPVCARCGYQTRSRWIVLERERWKEIAFDLIIPLRSSSAHEAEAWLQWNIFDIIQDFFHHFPLPFQIDFLSLLRHLFCIILLVSILFCCLTGIKLASAGLERLVLKDAERETHSDGWVYYSIVKRRKRQTKKETKKGRNKCKRRQKRKKLWTKETNGEASGEKK